MTGPPCPVCGCLSSIHTVLSLLSLTTMCSEHFRYLFILLFTGKSATHLQTELPAGADLDAGHRPVVVLGHDCAFFCSADARHALAPVAAALASTARHLRLFVARFELLARLDDLAVVRLAIGTVPVLKE